MSQSSNSLKFVWVVVVVILVSLGLAACGGGGGNESAAIGKSKSSSERSKATSLGEKAATDAGEPVSLKPETLGVIEITGEAEIIQRSTASLKEAASELGWKVVTCDAQGATAKFTSCARTLLNSNVTAMVSEAVESAPMQAQMEQA